MQAHDSALIYFLSPKFILRANGIKIHKKKFERIILHFFSKLKISLLLSYVFSESQSCWNWKVFNLPNIVKVFLLILYNGIPKNHTDCRFGYELISRNCSCRFSLSKYLYFKNILVFHELNFSFHILSLADLSYDRILL